MTGGLARDVASWVFVCHSMSMSIWPYALYGSSAVSTGGYNTKNLVLRCISIELFTIPRFNINSPQYHSSHKQYYRKLPAKSSKMTAHETMHTMWLSNTWQIQIKLLGIYYLQEGNLVSSTSVLSLVTAGVASWLCSSLSLSFSFSSSFPYIAGYCAMHSCIVLNASKHSLPLGSDVL